MAEPTNINISISNSLTSLQPTAVNYLTALAFQNTNTVISSGYNLRWSIVNVSTLGFTLSVDYLPTSGPGSISTVTIPYNVTNFILNTPTRYSLIDTTSPIVANIYSNITQAKIFPPPTVTLSQISTSVQVEFSAQYSSTNFAPTNIQISAIAIDNKPFIRTLTATIMQNTGNGIFPAQGMANVRWTFNQPIWAATLNGIPYTSNTLLPVSSIGTMVFYTTASTYDFTTHNFTLCSSNITAQSEINNSTNTYTFNYDTFPEFPITLYVNYENTNHSNIFYRTTAPQNFVFNLSASSKYFTFNNNFVAPNIQGWYTVNNSTNQIFSLTPQLFFTRAIPTISSVNVFVSASTPSNSFGPWYSSHIFSETLTAKFVTRFLSADFIGFPGTYFKTRDELVQLNFNNFQQSRGINFYGEGHTDFIYLCALPQQNAIEYNWQIQDNTTTQYPFSAIVNNIKTANLFQPLTSIYLQLTSDTDTNLRLPISLHVLENGFSQNDPKFFFDDITGNKKYYPYFYSTADIDNFDEENINNTQYKESILVKPYDPIIFEFKPGITETTFLQSDGTKQTFQATFNLAPLFIKCFDKYGLIWKWSNFEDCDQFANRPTSWESIQCEIQAGTWPPVPGLPGPFPKKWRNEGPLSAERFLINPIECSATNITWILSSTTNWPYDTIIDNTGFNEFIYTLNIDNFGNNFGTVSRFEPTNVTVAAEQTITCFISAVSPYTQTNDWKPKTTQVLAASTTQVITTPELLVYTPNKYVLSGVPIVLENLTTQKQLITGLEINFDDDIILSLTGDDIFSTFFTITGYNTLGKKDVILTAHTLLSLRPIVTKLTNLFTVINNYDTIQTESYIEQNSILDIPWPDQPQVGSNDWAINDTINQCFIKIYENLNYLQTKVQIYNNKASHFYGYLGVQPISAITPTNCLIWTWEDVDCLNTSLPYNVTWSDVLSVDLIEGPFISCGTWEDHYLDILQFTANCYGKYGVRWNWQSRKCQNSPLSITWQQTKCNEPFAKKWFFEPDKNTSLILCNEGIWNVDIPGLDEHYRNIKNSYIQPRCIYYGLVVKNNNLFLAQKTLIKNLSSDYNATFYDNRQTLDGVRGFSNIQNISIDSNGRIFVLDNLLNQVVSLEYQPNRTDDNWLTFTSWGGFGGPFSKNKFQTPNDIHVDQLDNVWVTDTGNNCIKHYSNTGTWLNTIFIEKEFTPLSTCIDSEQNIHILTDKNIFIFTYSGEFVKVYNFNNEQPRKLVSSYNREIVYVLFEDTVLKFFRNGEFAGSIIEKNDNIKNITGGYHDEFRNLYITSNDKVVKFADLMQITTLRSEIPDTYWKLNDILIHEEEYVQNWVYTRAFQRMWDNIEIFRNALLYNNKTYIPPIHEKNKLIIGQNELVTATVINRNIEFLWDNFKTILSFYNTNT